jgi:hypothetical protein
MVPGMVWGPLKAACPPSVTSKVQASLTLPSLKLVVDTV